MKVFLEVRLEEVVNMRYKIISVPYIHNHLMTKLYLSDLKTHILPRSEHSALVIKPDKLMLHS
jgi:hypothetical protein